MSRVSKASYRATGTYPVPITVQETYIYCPVCHIEYPQSQTDNHILRHTIQTSQINPKKEEQRAVSTQHSKNTFIYPMIEPLEFSTNQLSQVQKRDIFKLDRKQKNKKVPKVILMVDQQTQTLNRPLLQYRSDETDFYNCFDAMFNGGHLSYDDVVHRNSIIAHKRHLNEWQQQRVKK